MIKTAKKNVLGKGLDALIPQKAPATTAVATPVEAGVDHVREIEVSKIRPNKGQPRVIFDNDKLEELSTSIKEHGVIQPILLKPDGDGYQIIFGERRYRAVKLLGLKTIPAIISEASEEKSHVIALIENIQRENLNAIEEAEAYNKLIHEFNLTQEEVAVRVGKSRPAIANLLRLLKLPAEIQNFLIEKKLSMGHIRSLLAIENPDRQLGLAKKSVEEGLSVRELEKIVYAPVTEEAEKPQEKKPLPKPNTGVEIDPHILHLIDELQHKFMCKVEWDGGLENGAIKIAYHSGGELHRILEILGVSGQ